MRFQPAKTAMAVLDVLTQLLDLARFCQLERSRDERRGS